MRWNFKCGNHISMVLKWKVFIEVHGTLKTRYRFLNNIGFWSTRAKRDLSTRVIKIQSLHIVWHTFDKKILFKPLWWYGWVSQIEFEKTFQCANTVTTWWCALCKSQSLNADISLKKKRNDCPIQGTPPHKVYGLVERGSSPIEQMTAISAYLYCSKGANEKKSRVLCTTFGKLGPINTSDGRSCVPNRWSSMQGSEENPLSQPHATLPWAGCYRGSTYWCLPGSVPPSSNPGTRVVDLLFHQNKIFRVSKQCFVKKIIRSLVNEMAFRKQVVFFLLG